MRNPLSFFLDCALVFFYFSSDYPVFLSAWTVLPLVWIYTFCSCFVYGWVFLHSDLADNFKEAGALDQQLLLTSDRSTSAGRAGKTVEPEQQQQDKRLWGLGQGAPKIKKKPNWKGLLLGNGKRVMGIAYWALVLWFWGRCEADKDAQTFGARLTNPNWAPKSRACLPNEHVCLRIRPKHRSVSWPTSKNARHNNWFVYKDHRKI